MARLLVSALSPPNLQGVGALRPLDLEASSKPSPQSTQDLAQNLFQQSLQAATTSAGISPGAELLLQGREASASLLASLTAPQAPADTTPTLDSTTLPSDNSSVSTPLALSPATNGLGETLTTPDVSGTDTAIDLGLQTAMRFGAGVLGQGATDQTTISAAAELVRDATAVVRTGALRDQTTSPGPEAFPRPGEATNRLPKPYQVIPEAPVSTGLNLLV